MYVRNTQKYIFPAKHFTIQQKQNLLCVYLRMYKNMLVKKFLIQSFHDVYHTNESVQVKYSSRGCFKCKLNI